ncbi:hypothetical protein HK105_202755 [Polyrhizophydium stewartii]|uniref:Ankyrin repeat protein n=1 Tax=Polyrhizophydium stewartii TaxID=2732419 RepID=A0ABR4NED0_9FUNG|nr:hypothetical protein HK105_001542 [Polyrhizophydium stewartii]
MDALEQQYRTAQDRSTQLAARVSLLQLAVEHLETDNKRLSHEVAALQHRLTKTVLPAAHAPYRRINSFRPNANNEWDRMPAEIQNKILDAAGPFTRLVCKRLVSAELRWLPACQREQFWQDASDADWRGHPDLFPETCVTSKTLCMTRAFLRRIKSRLTADDFNRIAIRNGWVDMLDFSKPAELVRAAAVEDAVWLLEDLFDVRKVVDSTLAFYITGHAPSRVSTLEFLCKRLPQRGWHAELVSCAAHAGNLDILIWMRRKYPESLRWNVLRKAAEGNHMHVVRWLADNSTTAVCDAYTLAAAARSNNLEMVEFLAARFPQILNNADQGLEIVSSDMDVILWLDKHRLAQHDALAMHICSMGNIAVLDWLTRRFGVRLSFPHLNRAYQGRQARLIRWLYENRLLFRKEDAQMAVAYCNTDTLRWAVQRDHRRIPMLIEMTASHGVPQLVYWWFTRYGVVFRQRELELAIKNLNHRLVAHLLAMTGFHWDLRAACVVVDMAARGLSGPDANTWLAMRKLIEKAAAARTTGKPALAPTAAQFAFMSQPAATAPPAAAAAHAATAAHAAMAATAAQ